jgi:GNAT superfamily N-acetyltransferase
MAACEEVSASTPVRVRPMREGSDEAICARILELGWAMAFPARPLQFDVEAFRAVTQDEAVLVAEDGDGLIAGFTAVYIEEAFIHHLYVHPDVQGLGVGTVLLGAARQLAGGRQASLKCATGNRNALAFYAARGWTQAEVGRDTLGRWVRLLSPEDPDA